MPSGVIATASNPLLPGIRHKVTGLLAPKLPRRAFHPPGGRGPNSVTPATVMRCASSAVGRCVRQTCMSDCPRTGVITDAAGSGVLLWIEGAAAGEATAGECCP